MKPFRSRYTHLERKTNKKNMKQRQRNDVRTAKISWKIDQRITIVSNHNINIRHEIWNLLDQGIPTLKGKQTKKVWSRNKEARPAKPAVPKRRNNKDRMLVTSNKKLIKKYKATFKVRYNTKCELVWQSQLIWAPAKRARQTRSMDSYTYEQWCGVSTIFTLSVIECENNTFGNVTRRWK